MKSTINDRRKLSAMLIILLIVGFAAVLSTTMASNGNETVQEGQISTESNGSNSNSTVNINADSNKEANQSTLIFNPSEIAAQYNRTDVTPKDETEQVREREQTIFQYRNMTMIMNCTRNCTVSFTADEEITPKTFSLSVDPKQTMTLAMNLTRSPLNGAMVNERCLNFYLGIEPNAILELQAQIRLYINQTELSQSLSREVNSSRLTWMYWNQTRAQWEAVESYMDQNGYLVCNTDHFSTWTVAEIEPSEEGTIPPQQNTTLPIEYLAVGVVATIGIIALGFVAYRMRK